MAKWTIDDIPDLSGKIVIVTGGNSGLGYETVKTSAMQGAEVIMASRRISRGEDAITKIKKDHPDANISLQQLNLADLDSVESFGNVFCDSYTQLDYLFNNAGVSMLPRDYTVDGHEKQFGTNHLGHFALTGHLLHLIAKTGNSRVITTSSGAQKQGHIDFDDLKMTKKYSRMRGYTRSKTANLLFAYELQRKFEQYNIDSMSLAAHPGFARTNIPFQEDGPLRNKLALYLFKIEVFFTSPFFAQSALKGALPQLMAAYSNDVTGGTFYGPKYIIRGPPKMVKSSPYTHDTEVAKKLWEVSEDLTGVYYDFDSSKSVHEKPQRIELPKE